MPAPARSRPWYVVGLAAIGLAGPAAAEERASLVTETTLDRWQKELTPLIEAASGRRFVERPRLSFATQAQVTERKARLRSPSAPDGGAPARDSVLGDATPAAARASLGVYMGDTQEILLVTDTIEATFIDYAFAPTLLQPVMRCIVAHELVHALQHQVAPLPREMDPDATTVARALREGHADHVAGQVCGDGRRYLDVAQGLDIPASEPASSFISFAYGYADTFIGTLQAVAGNEAVWAALVAPPPPRALVTRVGGAGLPDRWGDTAPLTAAARVLAPRPSPRRGETSKAGAMSPGGVLGPLAVEDEYSTDVAALAGLGHYDEGPDTFVGAFAFLLHDEGAAAAWMARRRAALRKGRVLLLGGQGTLTVTPRVGRVGAFAKRDDLGTFSLRTGFTTGEEYLEMWVARGHHLYGVVHRDTKVDARAAAEALASLLDLGLPGPKAASVFDEPDRAALLAMIPAAPVATGVSWQFRRAQLYTARIRGDWATCLSLVDAALPGLDPAGRSDLAGEAMQCALEAADLGAADRLHSLIKAPTVLSPNTAAAYAGKLARASRWEETLAVLDAASEPSDTVFVAAVRLQAATNLGRWPEVERLVGLPEAPAGMRAWAAGKLARSGRKEPARAALRVACPVLSGEEQATCTRVLTQLGG
jgi:hypothetical protein